MRVDSLAARRSNRSSAKPLSSDSKIGVDFPDFVFSDSLGRDALVSRAGRSLRSPRARSGRAGSPRPRDSSFPRGRSSRAPAAFGAGALSSREALSRGAVASSRRGRSRCGRSSEDVRSGVGRGVWRGASSRAGRPRLPRSERSLLELLRSEEDRLGWPPRVPRSVRSPPERSPPSLDDSQSQPSRASQKSSF